MMKDNPILSICIQTYNRWEYLEKCIMSIINQNEFLSGEVEIIISDNCSSDGTQAGCERLDSRYLNFTYFRNSVNIADKNFPLALSRGKGIYRKLSNDSLLFKDGSLKAILDVIKDNIEDKPFIYFMNDGRGVLKTDSFEKFLRITSYRITWIGGIGLWNDCCFGIENKTENCESKLWQVPLVLEEASTKQNAIIVNEVFADIQTVKNKNVSYGIFNVFYVNYLSYLKEYVDKKKLSNECYDFLEKDLLYRFFTEFLCEWEINNKSYVFDTKENLRRLVFSAYEQKPYYRNSLW